MCGIFGHTDAAAGDVGRSRAALHTLAHRGPDQWGDWSADGVYLGHHRLSILDVTEAGRQPMVTQDEHIALTANGEIYNHRELRSELEQDHPFRSTSDSEVLLHGYAQWGIERLTARIEGMFAFCLFDRRHRRLHLVRDRVGIKPLYWGCVDGVFAWASELKALARFFGNRLRVDETAVYDYLTYAYVPSPKSVYRKVHKVEPAHHIVIDLESGHTHLQRYWQLNTVAGPIDVETAARAVRAEISSSVRAQLMSDVPVGVFLSGGVDSSAVVAATSDVTARPHTFSIGFEDDPHDETPFANLVAARFATDHRTRQMTQERIVGLADRYPQWFDEPVADSSAWPTNLVSAFAREHVTVALSGDGGDEVFGGYRWYDAYAERAAARVPSLRWSQPAISRLKMTESLGPLRGVFRRLEWRVLDDFGLYTRLQAALPRDDKTILRHEWSIPDDYDDYWNYRRYWRPDLPLRTRLQYLDFHTMLPDRFLTKVDRVSMAESLEVRVPLLSTPVVTLGFSLPESVRFTEGHGKGILRRAYRDVLPKDVLDRPKQGFGVPRRLWAPLGPHGSTPFVQLLLSKAFTPMLPRSVSAS